MKKCTKCGLSLSDESFYLRKSNSTSRRSKCKSCIKPTKEHKAHYDKIQYAKDKNKRITQAQAWYKLNKEKKKKYDKDYSFTRNERCKLRYKTDLNYKLKCNLRSRFYSAVRRTSKKSSVLSLLGCTISEFQIYIENKFTLNMSWDELMAGRIHIDHIIPCSFFDLSKEENQRICFHYTNLQPLWAKDNNHKRAKIMLVKA